MTLILIKHAMPQVNPDQTSRDWELGEEGINGSKALAQELKASGITRIITSQEPKAIQTGKTIAGVLNVPCAARDNLHEHDRRGVPYSDKETFHKTVAQFFAQPDQLIFGNETAEAARLRFDAAVRSVRQEFPDDQLAIVAHGTVITLFVAHYNQDVEAFSFWKGLDLPSQVAVSGTNFELITT